MTTKRLSKIDYRVSDPGQIMNIGVPQRTKPLMDLLVKRHRVSRSALLCRAVEFMVENPEITAQWAEQVAYDKSTKS